MPHRELSTTDDGSRATAVEQSLERGEPTPTEPTSGSAAKRSLRDLFRWHAGRVGWCTVGGIATGIAYLLTNDPVYTAQARLYVPPPSAGGAIAAALNTSAPQAPDNGTYLQTQAQLIGSDAILQHVGKHLPDAAKMRSLRKYNSYGDRAAQEYLRHNIDVDVNKQSQILEIAVEAKREREAITLVNAVADTYIEHQGCESRTVAGELLRTLREHKTSIVSQMTDVQSRIDRCKRDNANFSPEVAVAMATSKLKALGDQHTHYKLAAMQIAQSSLAPEHPERKRAAQLESDSAKALKSAQDEAITINAQLADYEALVVQLEQHKLASKQIDARINNLELQRDAEAARTGVAVIEPGDIVGRSLGARPLATTGVFMFCGALFGVAWSMHRDGSDRRLRCADDVHQAIGDGTAVLGVVPLLPRRRSHIGKAMATHLDPRGSAAEAHRTVRTSLFNTPGTRRTILVTSPRPGDGKSVCATNLALSLVQTGRSVILVDADLRRPSQHINLDLQNGTGLAGTIRSTAALRWAIQPSGIDNFDVLPAGANSSNEHPHELLDTDEFRALLTELAARYDHVVIDSPPVNVVNDAALITSSCDATILVVRAEQTTREDAAKALDMLAKMGGRVAGVVVNAAPAGENFGVYGGTYFPTVDTALRNQPVQGENVASKPKRDALKLPSQLQPA